VREQAVEAMKVMHHDHQRVLQLGHDHHRYLYRRLL